MEMMRKFGLLKLFVIFVVISGYSTYGFPSETIDSHVPQNISTNFLVPEPGEKTEAVCDNGWFEHNDVCYILNDTQMTMDEATKFCQSIFQADVLATNAVEWMHFLR